MPVKTILNCIDYLGETASVAIANSGIGTAHTAQISRVRARIAGMPRIRCGGSRGITHITLGITSGITTWWR